MAVTRQTLTQRAQAAVKRQLLEGSEAQFFRNWGDRIVAADPGELLASLAETLAGLTCGIVIECAGGPAPHHGEEDWKMVLTIFENPVLNRGSGGDGKTCDTVLDAVLCAFADGGAFWPEEVRPLPGEERVGWEVEGRSLVALRPGAEAQPEC